MGGAAARSASKLGWCIKTLPACLAPHQKPANSACSALLSLNACCIGSKSE